MRWEGSTSMVNRRALRKRSDSPTRSARNCVEQVPRPSTGERSHSCFLRGFSHGWPSPANSPSVPKAKQMTSFQVGFPPFITDSTTYLNVFHTRSVVISVGSPALAAYSLALTSLNTRFAYREVRRREAIDLQSRNAVTRALISVQQASLELTTDDRLLAFISDKGNWSEEIKERLYWRNAWSIAAATSVAWVVIAYLFTLIDSFVSLEDGANSPSEGQAVGTVWLWLICLVIGWLWVPTFNHRQLGSVIGHANQRAAEKAARRIGRRVSDAYSFAKTKITHRPLKQVSEEPANQLVPEPVLEIHDVNEKEEVESIKEEAGSPGQEAGPEQVPLPGLTYNQPSASLQLPTGSQHNHSYLTVSANPTAHQSNVSIQSSIKPGKYGLLRDKHGEGQLNRDEHRFAATFNYSRFIQHRVLIDDVLRALDRFTRGTDEKGEVSLSRNRLILEVVTLTLDRTLILRTLLSPWRYHSLQKPSLRCSSPRFSLLFSSVDRLPQLR